MIQAFYSGHRNSYLFDVGRGLISNASSLIKIGVSFDVGTSMEVVAPQGGLLHYLNSAEQLKVVSSSTNDVGRVRVQGTATGGTNEYLEDTDTDFISAGVQVGDVVVDNTTSTIDVISNVETNRLYVYKFQYNGAQGIQAGDSYKVVCANGTRAALVRLEGIDLDYDLIQD